MLYGFMLDLSAGLATLLARVFEYGHQIEGSMFVRLPTLYSSVVASSHRRPAQRQRRRRIQSSMARHDIAHDFRTPSTGTRYKYPQYSDQVVRSACGVSDGAATAATAAAAAAASSTTTGGPQVLVPPPPPQPPPPPPRRSKNQKRFPPTAGDRPLL